MKTVEQLISDKQVAAVHWGILRDHGLITQPKPGKYGANLTEKGKAYLRAAWTIPRVRTFLRAIGENTHDPR